MENPNIATTVGQFDPDEAARIKGTGQPTQPTQSGNGSVEKANVPLVEQARRQSVQLRGSDQENFIASSISSIFQSADTLPPWWSTARDLALSELWKTSDLLGGAMYMMASKMSTIPFHVEARDMSITAHLQDADRFERRLHESSEWGTGWGQFFQKQVESLLGQDNGRFMEIIDLSRNKSQAIKGPAISVAHLDPSRCLGSDSRVRMPDGTTMPIYEIVNTRYKGSVLSVNLNNGEIEEKKIVGWHKTKLNDRHWLRLYLRHPKRNFGIEEGLWLTNDHEVFTRDGWQRVDSLSVGDKIATETPEFSTRQWQIFVGTMLGDAHITRPQQKGYWSRLSLAHSTKQHDWLRLKKRAFSGFYWQKERQNKNSIAVETSATPNFIYHRETWYPNGKKIVPRELVQRFSSESMFATWFMDDGNLTHNGAIRLYTNSFSKEDVLWLVNLLTKRGYKSLCRSQKNAKGESQYYIYITVEGAKKFFADISRYIPPVMRYKVPDGNYDEYDSSLWDIETAERFYDEIAYLEEGDNAEQTATYCIDVEDNHNFLAGNIVVHNCMRTSNPRFPVLYRRTDGELRKLHWTRVTFEAQLPSERVDMFGVGLCGVSRSSSYARHMLDIAQYKEEKLGSRPHRGIITVGGGLDPEMVGAAFAVAGGLGDSHGLKRFAWMPVIGNRDIEEPTITLTSLSSLPDQFNEQESTEIAMAAIALAFGVDARELWPGMQAASTRADALLSHIKQRGKGPGHILQETERMFNYWYLPSYLKLVFDFQDDAQDRQKAEIRHERSITRKTDIEDGISDTRTERERMVKEGELTTAQFETIELADGRMPDGTPIEVLFHRDDSIYMELLTLTGAPDPLNFRANTPDTTLDQIDQNLSHAFELLATESRQIQKRQILQSIAALQFIQEEYEQLALIEQQIEQQEQLALESGTASGGASGPQSNPESEEPINKRPDDENNLATVENSPREFKKDYPGMNIRKALARVRNRNATTPQEQILKGLEELILENIPEMPKIPKAPIPIIHVEPEIHVYIPEQPTQDIHVHVEKQDTPEIIVQSPDITVRPEITIESPNITLESPVALPIEKEVPLSKHEVVEILERDPSGDVKKFIRRPVESEK